MILRYIYILFVGILLAVFVGVGIAAFYPEVRYTPGRPVLMAPPAKPMSYPAQYAPDNTDYEVFQMQLRAYNRNVSIIALLWAVFYVIISLTLLFHYAILSDGVLFGGLFTLIYSIQRGFQSSDDMFRFIVVLVSLIVVLIVGYIKFAKNMSPVKKRK